MEIRYITKDEAVDYLKVSKKIDNALYPQEGKSNRWKYAI